MKKALTLMITLLLTNTFICRGLIDHYGLIFHSHQFNQDERTGLNLNPDKSFNFSNDFSVEFDLKLTKKDLAYGYVCRIVSNDTSSLDLISNVNAQKINFVLLGSQGMFSNNELNGADIVREDYWIKVKLAFTNREIICNMDTVTFRIPYAFPDFRNIKIFFGANEHRMFYTTDVSPMTIRNILIRNEKEEIIRNWILAKHRGKEVYDEIKGSRASVVNGEWVIDQYAQWQKTGNIEVKEKNAQIATDSKNGRLFVATRDSLYIYEIATNKILRFRVNKGAPFMHGGSQLLYDNKYNRLISYSIIFPDLVIYDFEKNEWSADYRSEGIAPIQHHNRFIDPGTGELIVYGGYGNHIFKSELARHDPWKDGWQIDSISGIPPRFLSAAGYWKDHKFLLMGGFGSISGRQEESPRHFYDLYEIDYKNITSRKLADFPVGKEPYTLGNSLVIDNEENKIYALTYNKEKFHTEIYLFSVDLNNMQQCILGEPIPYRFLDTESFADLFLNKESKELYAVLLQGDANNNNYNIELYSLRYPPLQVSDILQKNKSEEGFFSTIIISVIFIFLILAGGGVIWYLRKKKTSQKKEQDITPADESVQHKINWIQEKPVSSVRLLGGFQVFNKKGDDITGSFSLMMKQMLLLFLLYSVKNEKGVTSQKLNDTFWLGMDKVNATNNRGVNIRKLRLLLQEVGDITISNENSYWFLHIGEYITCDYYNATILMKKIKQENTYDKETLKQLLFWTSGGSLLPNTDMEWIDIYKADFSDHLITILSHAAQQKDVSNDPALLLQIADVILLHDEINEFAIKMKCYTLYQQGQKGLSKQIFNRFCSTYLNILNTKPNFQYEDLIK